MHEMSDQDRRDVLGEALMDELKVIREYLTDLPEIKAQVKHIPQMLSDIAELKGGVGRLEVGQQAMRHELTQVGQALLDTNGRVNDLERTSDRHTEEIRILKQAA